MLVPRNGWTAHVFIRATSLTVGDTKTEQRQIFTLPRQDKLLYGVLLLQISLTDEGGCVYWS